MKFFEQSQEIVTCDICNLTIEKRKLVNHKRIHQASMMFKIGERSVVIENKNVSFLSFFFFFFSFNFFNYASSKIEIIGIRMPYLQQSVCIP